MRRRIHQRSSGGRTNAALLALLLGRIALLACLCGGLFLAHDLRITVSKMSVPKRLLHVAVAPYLSLRLVKLCYNSGQSSVSSSAAFSMSIQYAHPPCSCPCSFPSVSSSCVRVRVLVRRHLVSSHQGYRISHNAFIFNRKAVTSVVRCVAYFLLKLEHRLIAPSRSQCRIRTGHDGRWTACKRLIIDQNDM